MLFVVALKGDISNCLLQTSNSLTSYHHYYMSEFFKAIKKCDEKFLAYASLHLMRGLKWVRGLACTMSKCSQQQLQEVLIRPLRPSLLLEALLLYVPQAAHFLCQLPQASHLCLMVIYRSSSFFIGAEPSVQGRLTEEGLPSLRSLRRSYCSVVAGS